MSGVEDVPAGREHPRGCVGEVQTGARWFKMLEEHGATTINRLTISDILALLVNADPQGGVRWPKIKI